MHCYVRFWLFVSPGCLRLKAALLACAMALAVPLNAWSAESLSFLEAQRIAVQRSRQLAAQDAAVASAMEMALAAGQLPDPTLRLGVDNLPIEGPDRLSLSRDFMTMSRIGVSQEFTSVEKRRLRSARVEREADRSLAEKDAVLAVVARDTGIAWLEVFHLERLRAAVGEQIGQTRFEIEAAEGAYRGGRVSQADVLAARSTRVMLEDRFSELKRRVRNARAVLARWIGERAAAGELVEVPAMDDVPFRSHTLEQQLASHPEITVMDREVAIKEADVRLAQANKRADWTWELAYQKRGTLFSDMVSVGVSIPLQWDQSNRQDPEIAAKLALVDKARAQRDEALRQRLTEVTTMLNEWENGRERLARYRRELMPLARARAESLESAYRSGKGELAGVLAARRNEMDVLAQSIVLEIDTARVWAQLRFLYPDARARELR